MRIIILLPLLLVLSACVTQKEYDNLNKKYKDATEKKSQCQPQIKSLKNEINSCHRYLKVYRNNQESYKKSTNKGFE